MTPLLVKDALVVPDRKVTVLTRMAIVMATRALIKLITFMAQVTTW